MLAELSGQDGGIQDGGIQDGGELLGGAEASGAAEAVAVPGRGAADGRGLGAGVAPEGCFAEFAAPASRSIRCRPASIRRMRSGSVP